MQKNQSIAKNSYLKTIGINIRKLREVKGYSQFQLAIEAEIPKNQIGRIERGEINTSIYTLKRIADALKCTTCDILKEN